MSLMLITGGAGFIGVNSVRYFAAKGWDVTVLDNLSRRWTEDNLRWLQKQTPINFERADIRGAEAIERIARKVEPDALLHLAAGVRYDVGVAECNGRYEYKDLPNGFSEQQQRDCYSPHRRAKGTVDQ